MAVANQDALFEERPPVEMPDADTIHAWNSAEFQAFLTALGIEYQVISLGPGMSKDGWPHDKWSVAYSYIPRGFTSLSASFSTPFYRGTGNGGKPPSALDVFSCLAADFAYANNKDEFVELLEDLEPEEAEREYEKLMLVFHRFETFAKVVQDDHPTIDFAYIVELLDR